MPNCQLFNSSSYEIELSPGLTGPVCAWASFFLFYFLFPNNDYLLSYIEGSPSILMCSKMRRLAMYLWGIGSIEKDIEEFTVIKFVTHTLPLEDK